MKHRHSRGVSSVEFAFGMLVLLPLLLGTGVTGINMIRTLQTVQLARDAGHMYARGVDFSQPGNQTILVNLGSNLGLSATSGQGTAVVILSALTYVDKNACAAVGAVDGSGNPTSACTNYTKWVFTQRLEIGNDSVRSSNYGSPLTSGPTGVTISATTGQITQQQYVTRAGAVANFTGVNPYEVVNGTAEGLPSGQLLYVAEAGSTGFNMPPFVSNAVSYSWGLF
ncbi:MAG TPA: hypothetical protein VME43_15965 [Bryobacteraceae bacterium]|nr:hypothetical protein [Bryobacteraceae bacterium]